MSEFINYKQLKEDWKMSGEIPEWYPTNSLQFFMESYSYKNESVLSRDKTTCEWLAKYPEEIKLKTGLTLDLTIRQIIETSYGNQVGDILTDFFGGSLKEDIHLEI